MKTLKLHHNGFSNSSRTTLGTMETTSSCCFDRFVCVMVYAIVLHIVVTGQIV